jgi:hypothetical protein
MSDQGVAGAVSTHDPESSEVVVISVCDGGHTPKARRRTPGTSLRLAVCGPSPL